MASLIQSLNIYDYRTLCRKSDPRLDFKRDRATKETKYVALRDLFYLVQDFGWKRAKFQELEWGHLCGLE